MHCLEEFEKKEKKKRKWIAWKKLVPIIAYMEAVMSRIRKALQTGHSMYDDVT